MQDLITELYFTETSEEDFRTRLRQILESVIPEERNLKTESHTYGFNSARQEMLDNINKLMQ